MIPKNIKPTSYVFFVEGIVLIFLQIRRRYVSENVKNKKLDRYWLVRKFDKSVSENSINFESP